MIFNTLGYYVLFLLPTVIAFHRTRGVFREWVLALAGTAFFVFYSYQYLGGAIASACILLFLAELFFSRFYAKGSRWCFWGVAQAIAILFVFKYLNFAIASHNALGRYVGLSPLQPVGWLFLPLGISFFTFEFIHYAVDVYTGKLAPARLSRYAAFILFFPSMVAGPIKRFQDFDAKIEKAVFRRELLERGVERILVGLVKKQVFADSFAMVSDRLGTPALYHASRAQILAWVFAYGGRIYCDFSGYSDVAIGSGYLFGIEMPENFDFPYATTSITSFWRHWHMSLSSWIRDYVFIPLGGSRVSRARANLNTLLAFAVSGLWHGAGLNFILWGLWHGSLLVLHRSWRRVRPAALDGNRAWAVTAWALTFVSANLGWAFFCMDAGRALFALGRIAGLR